MHVWGSISWWGMGPIRRIKGTLNARKYTEEIIPDVTEICNIQRPEGTQKLIFQQDNAPPHSANRTKQFLAENGVKVLDWPANSPDFNPIEEVWAHVAARVRARGRPVNADQLWEWVQAEWAATPLSYIRSLYRSIPSRLQEAINNDGDYTHY